MRDYAHDGAMHSQLPSETSETEKGTHGRNSRHAAPDGSGRNNHYGERVQSRELIILIILSERFRRMPQQYNFGAISSTFSLSRYSVAK